MARKALGRGLDALIPGKGAASSETGPRLAEIALEQIRPNPQQPRDHFDESAIESIAASLAEHGVLQPVVVRRAGEGYELIAGERRWRAAQRAGLEKVPAVVRDATPRQSLELALIENVQRQDLNAIEEAQAYQLLVDEMGLTQEQVAERVGRDRSTVANYLRLLNLPTSVQSLIVQGELTMGHARALLGLDDRGAQRRLADEIVRKGLSVRQTESRVREVDGKSGKQENKTRRDPDVEAAETRLARVLGTPVTIRGKDKGRLEIRFTSLDELNRLYDLLIERGQLDRAGLERAQRVHQSSDDRLHALLSKLGLVSEREIATGLAELLRLPLATEADYPDLLPEAMRGYRHVVDTARGIVERDGFDEVATPIFEFSQVFKRTLGEASDVVTKEMYSFTDKGDEEITLRPENTAGVARAFISEGLAQQVPVRYFYAGPMFRYERPQKGRQRQFHQIGVELIGLPQPQADVEVIAAGVRVLEALGVLGETVLQLNTLGDTESRIAYRDALVGYFGKHREALSEDSQARLERNPLRILDSKDGSDRGIVADAPLFGDFLNAESTEFFDTVKAGLEALGIEFTVNPRLVRGLDYYCHTAFEFVTTALGAQGTVLAGGRYDGLIKMMGGPDTPGVGWAAGVERLAMLCSDVPEARRPVALIPLGADAEQEIFKIAERLRGAGFRIELGYSGNLGRRMKRANRVNASAAVIVGDDELARGTATVRNMESGSQDEVALASLEEHLAVYR